MTSLQVLDKWQGEGTSLPTLAKLPKINGGTIYLLDKPGAAQSVINIGKRDVAYDATGEHFKSYLMNYPLGGAFNSRINLNLREDKGYTYGARTGFRAGSELGAFVASASVRSDVTAESIVEFVKEIEAFQQSGMTVEELAFMKDSISQGQALDYETPYQKAGFMRSIQRFNLDKKFTEQQAKIVNEISADELNGLARKKLNLDEMAILVVGDKATIQAPLAKLGYKIVVL